MFEGSLIESQVTSLSATKRWTMAGSSALQIAIAATLVAVPLLHPERLTFHVETPRLYDPAAKAPGTCPDTAGQRRFVHIIYDPCA